MPRADCQADGSFRYAPRPMDLMTGYLGDAALVNGAPDAEVAVAATPYRFRLLNGSNARIFRVAFDDGRAFQVIAGDGGLIERPVASTALFLGPGERVEIVVDFSRDEAGRSLRLVSLPFSVGGGGTGPGMGMGGSPAQGAAFSLLRLTVSGTGPARAALPERLVPLERLGRAEVLRRFVMEMRMPPFAGNFTINGRSFDAGPAPTSWASRTPSSCGRARPCSSQSVSSATPASMSSTATTSSTRTRG